MISWKPSMDLRFSIEDGMKILQQRWVEYRQFAVTVAPDAPVAYETHATGISEWRDVPLIEEKTDDLAG